MFFVWKHANSATNPEMSAKFTQYRKLTLMESESISTDSSIDYAFVFLQTWKRSADCRVKRVTRLIFPLSQPASTLSCWASDIMMLLKWICGLNIRDELRKTLGNVNSHSWHAYNRLGSPESVRNRVAPPSLPTGLGREKLASVAMRHFNYFWSSKLVPWVWERYKKNP